MNEEKLVFNEAETIDYKTQLVTTQKVFKDMEQQLFTCLINVAMSGELSSADKFDVGDVIDFDENDFRNLDDQNVQLIFKVLDVINSSSATLANINNLASAPGEDETPF